MPSKSFTIRTDKNTWTFDVSLPQGGTPKVTRIYGDVTDRDALGEALKMLRETIDAPSCPIETTSLGD